MQENSTLSAPRVQKIELLNGLKTLSVEKRPEQTATVISLLIKTGSLSDPKDREGTAFLTAEAVRSANGKVPSERWTDELEFMGARVEIRVSTDATVFQAELPSGQMEAFLTFLTNIVIRPVFTKEGLEKLKQEVRSSALSPKDPLDLGKARLRELVFERSYCSRSRVGATESLNEIRVSDLELFQRSYYVPNNSALVIVGTPPGVRLDSLVREKFGSWVKGDLRPPEPVIIPNLSGHTIRIIASGSSDEAAIFLGHPGPTRQTSDYFSLQLAATVLGSLGEASRLQQALATKNIPYRSLSSDIQFGRGCGQFQVVTQVPVGLLQTALQTILDGIESLKAVPISDSEMSLARAKLFRDYAEILRSDARLADQVADIELYDLARDFLAEYPGRVGQITPERAQEAAKNYLSSTRLAAVIVGEEQAVRSALANFRSAQVVGGQEASALPSSLK